MNKKLLYVSILLVCISLISFSSVRAEQVTLIIMAPWAAEELEGFKPVMEAFEKQNPDIKIEYRSGKPEFPEAVCWRAYSRLTDLYTLSGY